MTDLMSGLDNLDAVFLGDDDDHCFQGGTFVRLSDVEGVVREALRNPTDEQVEQGAKELAARMEMWPEQRVDDEWSALTPADRADWITLTREAWAAAAGGDDE